MEPMRNSKGAMTQELADLATCLQLEEECLQALAIVNVSNTYLRNPIYMRTQASMVPLAPEFAWALLQACNRLQCSSIPFANARRSTSVQPMLLLLLLSKVPTNTCSIFIVHGEPMSKRSFLVA
jgi:hypothetical protein